MQVPTYGHSSSLIQVTNLFHDLRMYICHWGYIETVQWKRIY